MSTGWGPRDPVAVRLLVDVPPLNAGEVCGFDIRTAERLVAARAAVIVEREVDTVAAVVDTMAAPDVVAVPSDVVVAMPRRRGRPPGSSKRVA